MKDLAVKLMFVIVAGLLISPGAYASTNSSTPFLEKFENYFSNGLSPEDQNALRDIRQQDVKTWVQDKKQDMKERVTQLKNQHAQATKVASDAKNKREVFRSDFAQRIQEAQSLTGSARQQELASIAKDKADLEKAIADAKSQVKMSGSAQRKALSQEDADRTRARIEKEISAVERTSPAAQLKAFLTMRRNINLLLLAQKAVGADAKVAVLETMLTEVQARIDLLQPSTK